MPSRALILSSHEPSVQDVAHYVMHTFIFSKPSHHHHQKICFVFHPCNTMACILGAKATLKMGGHFVLGFIVLFGFTCYIYLSRVDYLLVVEFLMLINVAIASLSSFYPFSTQLKIKSPQRKCRVVLSKINLSIWGPLDLESLACRGGDYSQLELGICMLIAAVSTTKYISPLKQATLYQRSVLQKTHSGNPKSATDQSIYD